MHPFAGAYKRSDHLFDRRHHQDIRMKANMSNDLGDDMIEYAKFRAEQAAERKVVLEPINVLFHRLWTKAVGTEGYVKQEWKDLAHELAKFGVYL